MYNTTQYLLLLTAALSVIVDGVITYGCYRQSDSPCSQHNLACPDREVIALNDFRYNISYGIKKPPYACRQNEMEICNATCCRSQGRSDVLIPVNETERLSVYRTCSNQPTCTFTSPYSPDTDFDYIRYIYTCFSVDLMHNMMEITDVSFIYQGYLYYSGKTQTASSTRSCIITSTEIITIQSIYIDLIEESSYNVKIYSENQTLLLSGEDEGDLFYGYEELLFSGDKIYHLVFDNLTADDDDYIWISIKSNSVIIINCDDSTGFTSSDNQLYNMMEITDLSFTYKGYLHYSGRTQTTSSTRCCNVTSTKPIQIESVYIYLTEESSYHVKIYSDNQTLLRCLDEGGIFYGFGEVLICGQMVYHVVLDTLTVEKNDHVWITISADSNINITCDDCAGFTASPPQMKECRSESGCYGEPGSPCSTQTLTCDDGRVISIDERNEKRKIHYGTKLYPSCNPSLDTASCVDKKCCRRNIRDEHSSVDRDDRLQVYKNCSNKRTCSLTLPYTPDARYNYIYYPYICIPDNLTFDIINIDSTILPDEAYLYISNQQPYSGNLSCSLTSLLQTLRIESVFINLSLKSCSKIQIFSSRKQDLLNCSKQGISLGPELKVSGETITVQIGDFTNEDEGFMWIKAYGEPSIACTRNLPPSPVPGTFRGSSDQLGLIVGCVVGIVLVVLVVVVVVYCIIRRRRNKSGDNHQELEYTTKNNKRESEYDTVQDDDTNKRESSYHTIDDRFLQNSTKDRKSTGGPSSNTPSNEKLTYQGIGHDFTAKSSNIATPKENLTCQDIDHATFPNTASPKHDTNYTVIDHDFTAKAPSSTAPEDETGYTCIDNHFGIKAATQPTTPSPKDKTDYTYIDHEFSSDSIGPVGSSLNKASPSQESNYHIIDDDFSVKPKPGSGCCDPWESCTTLEPRSGLSTQPLNSKGKYSVVKPKNLRRQGEGKPSEYDYISTKTTADNLGKEEPLDPNYDHFKHTSFTPVVNENTDYDHIPKGGEQQLSDPYSDPTYDHLGEKDQTTKPQHDIARNMNSTSRSQYQPRKSKTNVDDPTYNHLVEKGSTTKPQQGNTVFPNPAFHGENKDVDDPFIDPTYNHLGENSHALKHDNSKNVDDPNNDDTYNHLAETGHTPQPGEGNHSTKNVDDPNNDDTYNHLGEKSHTPQPQDNPKNVDDPNNDDTYNHLGAKGHTPQPQEVNHNTKGVDDPNNDPTYNHLGENSHALKHDNSKNVDDPNNDDTYNHLGEKGHSPQPQEQSSDPTSDSQWRADDPPYNHLGDDKPESQKH